MSGIGSGGCSAPPGCLPPAQALPCHVAPAPCTPLASRHQAHTPSPTPWRLRRHRCVHAQTVPNFRSNLVITHCVQPLGDPPAVMNPVVTSPCRYRHQRCTATQHACSCSYSSWVHDTHAKLAKAAEHQGVNPLPPAQNTNSYIVCMLSTAQSSCRAPQQTAQEPRLQGVVHLHHTEPLKW
jgi:hypothetical protein